MLDLLGVCLGVVDEALESAVGELARSENDWRVRSRLLGDMMTRGFRHTAVTWRRSTWNIWAGVVRLQTCMLSSAHSCRNRSSRALECSGPWPS